APAPSVPPIAQLLLDAFTAYGNPADLTIAQLADHLVAADPGTWGLWEGKHNRQIMIGRTLKKHLKEAGLTIPTARLEAAVDPKRPTIYRLTDIHSALS
ncbi:hypothetical protein, partial [Streptomyces palmae]